MASYGNAAIACDAAAAAAVAADVAVVDPRHIMLDVFRFMCG